MQLRSARESGTDCQSMKSQRFRIYLIAVSILSAAALHVLADDWPQWRGPFRSGHAAEDAPALTSLPTELQPIWRIRVGGGFSSPVISGSKLVYQDERDGQEYAHLVDASTGKEVWKIAYATVFQDEWGAGPRSTPLIDEERVYVLSCNGEF